ncbi:MAG: HTH-type transcriptional regulator DmlR [Pseudomonadota bacterium]|jgi:DNA-binding transcriptional LysR family regulator
MDRLDAMQTFVRVAEAGSFIAVANQLQVARSVVTRQVAALEKHLGTTLITRSTRRLTLTAAGADYLEKCRAILNMVDAAESGLSDGTEGARGRIRIGLPLNFGLQELLHPLLDFMVEQPGIELILYLSDHRANLIEEGLDLSIRITSQLKSGDIVRRLGECRLVTLASPDYLARHGEPKRPDALLAHECLVYANDTSVATWHYREGGKSRPVLVRGRLVANNGEALLEAAARGMGITRQPDFLAAASLESGRLRTVLSRFEDEPLGIYAVLPGNRYIPRRVSLLITRLAARLSGGAGASVPAR